MSRIIFCRNATKPTPPTSPAVKPASSPRSPAVKQPSSPRSQAVATRLKPAAAPRSEARIIIVFRFRFGPNKLLQAINVLISKDVFDVIVAVPVTSLVYN